MPAQALLLSVFFLSFVSVKGSSRNAACDFVPCVFASGFCCETFAICEIDSGRRGRVREAPPGLAHLASGSRSPRKYQEEFRVMVCLEKLMDEIDA